jgi:hypothetical protein
MAPAKGSKIARLAANRAHLTFFWSADILVRFGVVWRAGADKNVRAPSPKPGVLGRM